MNRRNEEIAPGGHVIVRYEACVAFEGDATGTSVCVACGWLDDEHVAVESRRADVRELPTQSPVPARLAS